MRHRRGRVKEYKVALHEDGRHHHEDQVLMMEQTLAGVCVAQWLAAHRQEGLQVDVAVGLVGWAKAQQLPEAGDVIVHHFAAGPMNFAHEARIVEIPFEVVPYHVIEGFGRVVEDGHTAPEARRHDAREQHDAAA